MHAVDNDSFRAVEFERDAPVVRAEWARGVCVGLSRIAAGR